MNVYIGLWCALVYCCLCHAGTLEHASEEELLVGAPALANAEDPDVLEAANFAVDSISESSGSPYKLGLVRILSVTRQVVSGTAYTITLQAARSDCSKAAPRPVCACAVLADAADTQDPDFKECTVKVWDQSWRTPRYKLMSVECPRQKAIATD